ncbi:4815_t:CDS:2 [Rhizophagus irregularis]|nr:4815_t:CDS:2 [Rhizophagus irregularis]
MEHTKYIITSFHIHLPANIEKLGGYPVVIGDGSELGDWEHNTVKLYKPSNNNPTYWRSKDTKITFSKKSKIQYNYAIYIPAAIFRRPKKIIYEGQNSSDESLPDSAPI